MVLTRASQPMRTRSQGPVRDSAIDLPAKRRRSAREGVKIEGEDTQQPFAPQSDADERSVRKRSRQEAATAYSCSVCLEVVPSSKVVELSGCQHRFCRGCIKQLVRTSLKDKSYPVPCPDPGCSCALDPLQDICPAFSTRREAKEFSQLLDVAAVSCVPEKDRFYCPNATCSALYQLTNNRVPGRCKDTRRACHSCQQNFCMRCAVTWHDGLTCAAYQALPAEERSTTADLQVHAMAQQSNWKRCPSCRFFVERLEGCSFMACHCGCNFDYNTGEAYENGIGPAHLFAPEWVDDHLALMAANLAHLEAAAAETQAAAAFAALAAQHQGH